jgi:hypothetical protein
VTNTKRKYAGETLLVGPRERMRCVDYTSNAKGSEKERAKKRTKGR